jgi:hypothetical protein
MIETNLRRECGGRRTIPVSLRAALAAVLASLLAATAQAQCVGDCDANNEVGINELIQGVNISLGTLSLENCAAFDANDSGEVEINELITAVNNALSGCGPGGTATITRTAGASPTPTSTSSTPPLVTATATPTRTSVTPGTCATNTPVTATGCGDGFVDLGGGETCDDGNNEEGDDCPGNCRIATCQPSGTTVTMRFDFDTIPADLFIQGLELFVRYPESVITVPGVASDPPVLESVTSEVFSATPFDHGYGVKIVLSDPSFVGYEDGTAATIVFDLCEGASAPTACDVTCTVDAAVDAEFNDVAVDQVPCTVTIEP